LREKFTNDSNFFVREVGRGNGVLERSLELQKCCEGEEGDDDRKPVCTFWKKVPEKNITFILCVFS